ncbi:Three-deoxy-D-manno-octulosonic-acid transferase domain-containing protein [Thermovirga lienii DSM 17291]|uniref:3-deoxy-D-manno-octulosonic acid transferase n=1 Tax=Thermovirga lienii (strain ATCC BAA-1197 / DSM 17291 / Cas60314) TaxID=580340 RepID=G7V8D4_THELD|nr:Three-deoxy-D-manno-octulosonic-acid transferase domain-containing protein [Thermovirga lienii DSM 17291]
MAYVASFPYLAFRYREGLKERLGYYEKLKESPLWVHAVSVGEVQAAFPMVKAIQGGGNHEVLLSTITSTGRCMARKLLGDSVRLVYYPWDVPWIVKRTLDRVNPKAYVTVETELWPNLLYELKKRGIPAFLANARFSERSFRKARRHREFWCSLLDCFEKIMARSEEDMTRFLEIGVSSEKVVVTGDCKIDALLARRSMVDVEGLRRSLNPEGKRVLLAGSTHEGEDSVVLEAFSRLKDKVRDVRLILAPRHPHRAQKLWEEAKKVGRAVLLSKKEPDWEIMVVDQVGVLFDLYGIADAAFIGGSLVPKGGQNILEPASWGVPIQHGPFMDDFGKVSRELIKLGCAKVVKTAAELYYEWEAVSNEGAAGEIRCPQGKSYVEGLGGAALRNWEIINKSMQG